MRIETVICQRCGQPIPRYNVQGAKLCTDCYREFLEFFRDFLNGTETERAYKIVYNDLMECDFFRGHYDAKHGNETFVRGIGTVMENIALHVSEETANQYMQEFINNIQDARKKGGIKWTIRSLTRITTARHTKAFAENVYTHGEKAGRVGVLKETELYRNQRSLNNARISKAKKARKH